jgi:ribonucleoside-diphosphate reductase alpha chain
VRCEKNEETEPMSKDSVVFKQPIITEVRPQSLECDVVRFQNNKEKWVAFVGLLDGYPYEIFTGLQDDEEGIVLPKSVTKGKIIKNVLPDGTKRYDFQFQNKRGYKTTVEGLSEKFNPEYWNYAKLLSGVLRYRMPLDHVIRLVGQLSLTDDNINTWKNGVERALKKYIQDDSAERDILSSSDEASIRRRNEQGLCLFAIAGAATQGTSLCTSWRTATRASCRGLLYA